MRNVYIIDSGIGNIASVKNWFLREKIMTRSLNGEEQVIDPKGLIVIPGACHSGALALALKEKKLDKTIINHVAQGGLLLGICAGMHVLFEHIHEGDVGGLCLLNGEVIPLEKINTGWKNLSIVRGNSYTAWPKSKKKKAVGRIYLNHGYKVLCDADVIQNKVQSIDGYVPNIVVQNNVIGIQGHPEKSQDFGREFVRLLGVGK